MRQPMATKKRPKPKKDPAAWDRLVDDLFELDAQHPYLSQSVEEPPPPKRPKD